MKWRRWLLVLLRDLGYFFSGVVVLYGISGIAVNHRNHWDPSFIIERKDVVMNLPPERQKVTKAAVLANLEPLDEVHNYMSFDFPSSKRIKIYLKDGSIMARLSDGQGVYETIRQRPLFYEANRLHLSPKGWWLAFSDLFSLALLFMAFSGLFITRGRNGFAGRGKWLVGAGLVVPILALVATY